MREGQSVVGNPQEGGGGDEQDTTPYAMSAKQGSLDAAADKVAQRCLMLLSVAYPTEFSLKPGEARGDNAARPHLSSSLTPLATAGAKNHGDSNNKLRCAQWSSPVPRVPVLACFAVPMSVVDDSTGGLGTAGRKQHPCCALGLALAALPNK